jgi:membrane fusion protein, multidrug efflux system
LRQVTPLNPRERTGESAPAAPHAPAPVVAPPPATPQPAAAPAPIAAPSKPRRRGSRRFVLLVLLPALVVAGGFYWWLGSGRYVTTDNAYVGADKVLITPQVSGAVLHVDVVEGQHVEIGDKLFEIDPAPYRIALALAKGRLEAARVAYQNLRISYKSNEDQIRMGADAVKVRQSDYDRKSALLSQRAGTAVDADTAAAALIQAKQILAFVEQQQSSALVKLGGALDAPLENFPDYVQAKAQVEDAERNLNNASIVAPMAGVATQVTQIQLGRVAMMGTPIFAIIADRGLWVDANPKESDLTYVHTGLPATITVDTFPDRSWRGKVGAIAPGTGAQFAILPPQNASGNWVKVVQRVPLRVEFDADQDTHDLRAGMSAYISIDTGRVRTLKSVLADLEGVKNAAIGAPAPASGDAKK